MSGLFLKPTILVQSTVIYINVNGQVASADTSAGEAVVIGQTMASSIRNTLTNDFEVKFVNQLTYGVTKVGGKTVFDLGTIFIRQRKL